MVLHVAVQTEKPDVSSPKEVSTRLKGQGQHYI